ncbi:unnamed protein product [Clavelina lepadiformis]|uniref:Uncharacterized protein n=1 Tax=Clavelina lepadiformis TaxID=159417 RepID=A0ABP0FPP3_CLALP
MPELARLAEKNQGRRETPNMEVANNGRCHIQQWAIVSRENEAAKFKLNKVTLKVMTLPTIGI